MVPLRGKGLYHLSTATQSVDASRSHAERGNEMLRF